MAVVAMSMMRMLQFFVASRVMMLLLMLMTVPISTSTSTSGSCIAMAASTAMEQNSDACIEGGNGHEDHTSKWNWDPTYTTHPCTIHRISRSELHNLYGPGGLPNLEYPFPIIIYPDNNYNEQQPQQHMLVNDNTKFANSTTYTNLPTNFPPNFQVTLSGSDSLSSHRRTIPLHQYLSEIITANNKSGTTLPTQLGNETWYFFGETHSSIWSTFLQAHYMLPPCQTCTPQNVQQYTTALSFGIGNIGSGVQWHIHGPGLSETIHGRKHWVLYPPELEPIYDLNYASRHWMENTYPTLEDWTVGEMQYEASKHEEFWQRWMNTRQQEHEKAKNEEWVYYNREHKSSDTDRIELGPSKRKPWECTVNEGEIIYFPNLWHHATINLEKYTVFVSTFT